jgi:hypothetical protein
MRCKWYWWNKKWWDAWDASDIVEIRSDEMQLISEFVSIDAKGEVK